jgi:hypothetical protein
MIARKKHNPFVLHEFWRQKHILFLAISNGKISARSERWRTVATNVHSSVNRFGNFLSVMIEGASEKVFKE